MFDLKMFQDFSLKSRNLFVPGQKTMQSVAKIPGSDPDRRRGEGPPYAHCITTRSACHRHFLNQGRIESVLFF